MSKIEVALFLKQFFITLLKMDSNEEISRLVSTHYVPHHSTGVAEIEKILKEQFDHDFSKKGAKRITDRGFDEKTLDYVKKLISVRRSRIGENLRKEKMKDDDYKRKRNDWFMDRHRKRRAEADNNIEKRAWFNVTYLLANLKRRNMTCTVSRQELIEMSCEPCFYCGEPESGGIDRYDNYIHYHRHNIVPCCKICNSMKGGMHGDHFLAYCTYIMNPSGESNVTFRSQTSSFSKYKSSATQRGRTFNITEEEFNEMFHKQCSFCKLEDARGIDRVDNGTGYEGNGQCRPMCFVCNYALGELSDELFFEKIKKIVENHPNSPTIFIGRSQFTWVWWEFSESGAKVVKMD